MIIDYENMNFDEYSGVDMHIYQYGHLLRFLLLQCIEIEDKRDILQMFLDDRLCPFNEIEKIANDNNLVYNPYLRDFIDKEMIFAV